MKIRISKNVGAVFKIVVFEWKIRGLPLEPSFHSNKSFISRSRPIDFPKSSWSNKSLIFKGQRRTFHFFDIDSLESEKPRKIGRLSKNHNFWILDIRRFLGGKFSGIKRDRKSSISGKLFWTRSNYEWRWRCLDVRWLGSQSRPRISQFDHKYDFLGFSIISAKQRKWRELLEVSFGTRRSLKNGNWGSKM